MNNINWFNVLHTVVFQNNVGCDMDGKFRPFVPTLPASIIRKCRRAVKKDGRKAAKAAKALKQFVEGKAFRDQPDHYYFPND